MTKDADLCKEQFREVLDASSGDRKDLLTVLEKTQDIYGFLPVEAEKEIGEKFGIAPAQVVSTQSFYSFFHANDECRYVVTVCTTVPCQLNGAKKTLEAVEEALGIVPGETTEDGRFRLETCGCLGACDKAPAIMVNDRLFGPVEPQDVGDILAEFCQRRDNDDM